MCQILPLGVGIVTTQGLMILDDRFNRTPHRKIGHMIKRHFRVLWIKLWRQSFQQLLTLIKIKGVKCRFEERNLGLLAERLIQRRQILSDFSVESSLLPDHGNQVQISLIGSVELKEPQSDAHSLAHFFMTALAFSKKLKVTSEGIQLGRMIGNGGPPSVARFFQTTYFRCAFSRPSEGRCLNEVQDTDARRRVDVPGSHCPEAHQQKRNGHQDTAGEQQRPTENRSIPKKRDKWGVPIIKVVLPLFPESMKDPKTHDGIISPIHGVFQP